jgi:hypothetical protein
MNAHGTKYCTDKKVENDVRNDNVEGAEEDHGSCEIATICFPVISARCAKRWQHHTVVHDLVPVFTRHNTEKHDDASWRTAKVGLSLPT